MTFRDVVTRLEQELRRELPGPEAQASLSPIPRREWPAGFNQARIRNAAGLLLVFPKPDTTITINAETAETAEPAESEKHESLRAPRALRSADTTINAKPAKPAKQTNSWRASRALRSPSADAHIVLTVRADALRHGGQVSLPGGVVEPGETFEQAALREAHEEIALTLAHGSRARRADAARHSSQRIPPPPDCGRDRDAAGVDAGGCRGREHSRGPGGRPAQSGELRCAPPASVTA